MQPIQSSLHAGWRAGKQSVSQSVRKPRSSPRCCCCFVRSEITEFKMFPSCLFDHHRHQACFAAFRLCVEEFALTTRRRSGLSRGCRHYAQKRYGRVNKIEQDSRFDECYYTGEIIECISQQDRQLCCRDVGEWSARPRRVGAISSEALPNRRSFLRLNRGNRFSHRAVTSIRTKSFFFFHFSSR